jgi:hypothetical protein
MYPWERGESRRFLCLYRAPPRNLCWRSHRSSLFGARQSRAGQAAIGMETAVGCLKCFPGLFLCEWLAKVYSAGRRDAWRGKIPDADNGQVAPEPGSTVGLLQSFSRMVLLSVLSPISRVKWYRDCHRTAWVPL